MNKYNMLPRVSEHVIDGLMREIHEFTVLMKHDLKAASKSVREDIEWLKENKDFLGRAVEAAVDSALELYDDKLTHRDWVELELFLLKGVLLLLQAVNEGLKERCEEIK